MPTYLVTGAAGFIAAKVCEQLIAEGNTVVGVDNLNDYYDVRLKDYRLSRLFGVSVQSLGDDPRKSVYATNPLTEVGTGEYNYKSFTFKHIDIEHLPALEALFQVHNFDAVFNLAARAGVRYSMENPHVYLSTNAMGTLNLLECQRKYSVPKHVLASTSSLYAGCKMPFSENLAVNEPLSPYAATKKSAEVMAYCYHKLYGIDVSVLRYFTVYGPASRPDMSILRFIKWIDEGVPIELFGDGTQSRDFTYIDDIARGTILAVKPINYEVINLGGGRKPISINAMISCFENALGKKAQINRRDFHAADMVETWADISKAKRLLNWEPYVGPEEGFRRSVAWHAENRDWLRDIIL